MSAIARYFKHLGMVVVGYDKTSSNLTEALEKEGIQVFFEDRLDMIVREFDLVVYTPAIPANSVLLNHYKSNHSMMMKRSEVLGLITKNAFTIAVAGSHGKTTVCSMIAHVLKDSGYDCTAFLGGISKNFNSNYIGGNNNVVIVEADEYDRSFHRLNPNIAVITSVDSDHLDIYGSLEKIEEAFIEFTNKVDEDGIVFVQGQVKIIDRIVRKVKTYSARTGADLMIDTLKSVGGNSVFTTNKTSVEFTLYIGGKHNVENALAAISVAMELGISEDKIAKAIASFRGIKRRFEKHIETADMVYIDDYAHHPEELNALIDGVKGLYPGRKITLIFQPHLFSRTQDLAVEFGKALTQVDRVFLLDIYPARELPIAGVTSDLILQNIAHDQKKIIKREDIASELKQVDVDVLLTVGAGDIDRSVELIKNYYQG